MTEYQKKQLRTLVHQINTLLDEIEVESDKKETKLVGRMAKMGYEHGFAINDAGFVDIYKSDVEKLFGDEVEDDEFYANRTIFMECYNKSIGNLEKSNLTQELKDIITDNYNKKMQFVKEQTSKRMAKGV